MSYSGIISQKRKFYETTDENKTCIRLENGEMFHVDPEVLIRNSKYFKALFQYESHRDIVIKGISSTSMNLVLSLIQNNTMRLNAKNVAAFMRAADYFMLDDSLQRIRPDLLELISDENCLDLYFDTMNSNQQDIFETIKLYVQTHFKSVVRYSSIDKLTSSQIVTLISDNQLNVSSEEIVWKAVVKWVKTDAKTRYHDAASLLGCIRLEVCDDSLLQEMIDHPIVRDNDVFSSINVMNKLRSRNDVDLRARFIETIKRLSSEPVCLGPREPQRVLCRVAFEKHCNWDSVNWHKSIEVLMSSVDGSKKMEFTLKMDFIPKFVINCKHAIYAFGYKGNLFTFDLMKRKKVPVSAPKKSTNQIFYCFVNDRVTSCYIEKTPSGFIIATAVFSFQSKKWQVVNSYRIAPSTSFILWHEAAAVADLIYFVVGAMLNFRQYMLFTKVYDAKLNYWTNFEIPSSTCTEELTFASFKGALYCMKRWRREVYKFHAETGIWTFYQMLPRTLCRLQAVVHDDTLIAFEDTSRPHSYYWDEDLQMWLDYKLKRSGVTCNIFDADVVWKYHLEFQKMEDENSSDDDSSQYDVTDEDISDEDFSDEDDEFYDSDFW